MGKGKFDQLFSGESHKVFFQCEKREIGEKCEQKNFRTSRVFRTFRIENKTISTGTILRAQHRVIT